MLAATFGTLFVTTATWAETPSPRAWLLALNEGTEITDLLVPYAVLSDAGMAVEILAAAPGSVDLMTGFEILDVRSLATVRPTAHDLVVVPAVHDPGDPRLLQFIRQAYETGAFIASICDGVEVLARAGILEGRKATGHFYSAKRRRKDFPDVLWQEDVRFVKDGTVLTSAGVSASAPAAVNLVEHFLGKDAAHSVATKYGIDSYGSATHASDTFHVGIAELSLGLRNLVMGLHKTTYNIVQDDTVDEFTLAFALDSLVRTFRARVAVAGLSGSITTKRGLRLRGRKGFASPDWHLRFERSRAVQTDTQVLLLAEPAQTLPVLFRHLADEYGPRTMRLVGLQLEIPSRGAGYLAKQSGESQSQPVR